MRRTFILAVAFVLCAAVFADNEKKQTVTINGASIGKSVSRITFDGDNANLTFTDGMTETIDMEAVVISFQKDPSAITIAVCDNGSTRTIHDISGREMSATLEGLPAGIYIIKSANKTVKYIKK